MEGGKPVNPEKNPRSKDENQQQTQNNKDLNQVFEPAIMGTPTKPMFSQNRWSLKSGLGPCYLRSSMVPGRNRTQATWLLKRTDLLSDTHLLPRFASVV